MATNFGPWAENHVNKQFYDPRMEFLFHFLLTVYHLSKKIAILWMNSVNRSLKRKTKERVTCQRHLGTQGNTGNHFLGLIGYVVLLVPRNSNNSTYLINDSNLIWNDRLSCGSPTTDVSPNRGSDWINQNIIPLWSSIQSKPHGKLLPWAQVINGCLQPIDHSLAL